VCGLGLRFLEIERRLSLRGRRAEQKREIARNNRSRFTGISACAALACAYVL